MHILAKLTCMRAEFEERQRRDVSVIENSLGKINNLLSSYYGEWRNDNL